MSGVQHEGTALMTGDELPEAQVLGDRIHVHPADSGFVFDALTTGINEWLRLERGEQSPELLDMERPTRVLWSSLWPVSPSDTIEFLLEEEHGATRVRFIWRSKSPPDARGVAITRQRLNRKVGGDLRSHTGYSGPVNNEQT